MIIENIEIECLASIVAGLVREGVTFDAKPQGKGLWRITLTGGF